MLRKHRDAATAVEIFVLSAGSLIHLATSHILDRNRVTELASLINGKINVVFVLVVGKAIFETYLAE